MPLTGGGSTKAHVFVDDLARPVLADGDRHHLERALRLRPGHEITVCDGAGGWRVCRFGADLEPASDVVRIDRPSAVVTVAFAVAKGDRTDWAVQKLTEIGADRIVPLHAARSVVRWEGERAAGHVERLRRVAREAAMQSRRLWLPEIGEVSEFATAATWPGAALADRGGDPPSLDRPTVLVGPEGGWNDAERHQSGLPAVTLGPAVLRIETAAVVAGTLLCALREGLVRPNNPLPGTNRTN